MSTHLGIIGAGAIGRKHAEAARKVGVAVRWVVDPCRERAEDLAAKCGAEPLASPELLWGDAAVGAVIVGAPNKWHAELAVAALEAGKDVLLEKPMGTSVAECRRINAAAQAGDRVLQLGFVHRYTGVGRTAERLARAGACGEIYHARAQLRLRRGVPGLGKWFTTKEIAGGGALIDVGVHLVDLALHVLGYPEIREVMGQTYATFGRWMRDYVYQDMWAGPPDYDGVCDVEDAAHAFIRFVSGATLALDVAWAGNFPEASVPASSMGFFGDRGGMAFELFGNHVDLTREVDGAVADERIDAPETDFYYDQLVDFLEAVATRRVAGASGLHGERVQSIVESIYADSIDRG
ncbi:MAG: Gfo/Idh/MocA family oxidoreductase [Pirellulales bacterium]|nr:Gfo/Idh/MocA family oxidoreductase [Pirellulales bacterium]